MTAAGREDRRRTASSEAWAVIEACTGGHGYLVAAADSSLYPHVWARDVGVAAQGICMAARTDSDIEAIVRSLELLARGQSDNGRIPLKVDPETGEEVSENSAGVDTGLWFALGVRALAARSPNCAQKLVQAVDRALVWTEHLDLTGAGLLISPEASDWADMTPHRHHVLSLNVLYSAALDAAAELAAHWPKAFSEPAETYRRRAESTRDLVLLRFGVSGLTSADRSAEHLSALARVHHEWGLTGQHATILGDLPYLLPYADFRTVGRHCDVVGNLLAIQHGISSGERALRTLDHLWAVGAADPWPTVSLHPPITPGHPDYRDYFHWRSLNVPGQYQNGGSWPFIGALHVIVEAKRGRPDRAETLLDRLIEVCLEHDFPEWCHGRTGRPMGEPRQLWSASGLLWAVTELA